MWEVNFSDSSTRPLYFMFPMVAMIYDGTETSFFKIHLSCDIDFSFEQKSVEIFEL